MFSSGKIFLFFETSMLNVLLSIFSMFPQDHHVLACLALPGRILVAVQLNDQTFLHVYDAVAEVSEYKKPLTAETGQTWYVSSWSFIHDFPFCY